MSRRGNLEGVEDEFIDNMVRGIEASISAAQRNLICWGYMTFTKPVNDRWLSVVGGNQTTVRDALCLVYQCFLCGHCTHMLGTFSKRNARSPSTTHVSQSIRCISNQIQGNSQKISTLFACKLSRPHHDRVRVQCHDTPSNDVSIDDKTGQATSDAASLTRERHIKTGSQLLKNGGQVHPHKQ